MEGGLEKGWMIGWSVGLDKERMTGKSNGSIERWEDRKMKEYSLSKCCFLRWQDLIADFNFSWFFSAGEDELPKSAEETLAGVYFFHCIYFFLPPL